MPSLAFAVIATALLSALATALAAWLAWRRVILPRLESRLAALELAFEARVRAGALAAGEALLPQLREEVRLGFEDALRGSAAGGLVENAADLVNRGTGLVAGSLGALLGPRRR